MSRQPTERPGRPMTHARLEAGAFHYLARFAASEARLRSLLSDRIRRANPDLQPPDEMQRGWIGDVVEKCRRLGLVDDAAFALMKARSRLARGHAPMRVRAYLGAQGIAADLIESALSQLAEETGEDRPLAEYAALRFARRRRFGPWRDKEASPDRRKREIAAFARAGFAYGIARKIVDAADPDALTFASGDGSRDFDPEEEP